MTVPSLTGVRGAAALWVLLFHVQSFANGYGCLLYTSDAADE